MANRAGVDWPQFRGPRASGIAEGFPAPTSWSVPEKKNIRWKTPVPGLSHSSPVIWDDRLFIATAISAKNNEVKVGLYGDIDSVKDDAVHEWWVYCLDKKTGKVLWRQLATKSVPKVKRHTKASHASSTLATDGKSVVAFFGSEGLFCLDAKTGKTRWKRDFGLLDSGYFMAPEAQWGFASSPIIDSGRVIVQCDVQKGSFVAALDLKNGKTLWKTDRADVPTWSTPNICEEGGRKQVVVNGWKHLGGYDFLTGKPLWKLIGGGDIPVPTPIVAHGLIYLTNAHGRMAPIYAVKPKASGEINLPSDNVGHPSVAWFKVRDGAYMQTPLVYGPHLYVCRDNGVLGCYDAKTGDKIYQERLGTGRTGFTASAVASDGKLYFTGEEGSIFVVQAGPTFKLLSNNEMDEICMATPALSEGKLYFRTQSHVVSVG
jgi:outer membrane protein assembly factor BamB